MVETTTRHQKPRRVRGGTAMVARLPRGDGELRVEDRRRRFVDPRLVGKPPQAARQFVVG